MKHWMALMIALALALGTVSAAESNEEAPESAHTTSEAPASSQPESHEKPPQPERSADSDGGHAESSSQSSDDRSGSSQSAPQDSSNEGAVPQPTSQGESSDDANAHPTVQDVQGDADAPQGDSDGNDASVEVPTSSDEPVATETDADATEGDIPDDPAGTSGDADIQPETEASEGTPEDTPEGAPTQEEAAFASPDEQVLRIQGYLIQLGYLSASHRTGIYDAATRSAVARFQSDNGLPATGVCDSATLSKLKRRVNGQDSDESESGNADSEPTEVEDAGQTGAEAGHLTESPHADTPVEAEPDPQAGTDLTDESQETDTSGTITIQTVSLTGREDDLETEDAPADAAGDIADAEDEDENADAIVSEEEADNDSDADTDAGTDGMDDPEAETEAELDGEAIDNGPRPPRQEDIGNADDAEDVDLYGLSDAQILKLQLWLIRLGYLADAQMTGLYDEDTQSAIARFQSENELEITEMCDSATYLLIYQRCRDALNQQPSFPGGRFPGGFPRGMPSGGMPSGGAAPGAPEDADGDDPLNGIIPGEALTSSHSSGNMDTTRYGAVAEVTLDALSIALREGDTLETLHGAEAAQAIHVDHGLFLGGDGRVQEWTLNGAALRTLYRSGVNRIVLVGCGQSITLSTVGMLSGQIYSALRANGQTDNTFRYTITFSEGNARITAAAGDDIYDLTAAQNGTWTMVPAGGKEA